MVPPSGTMEYHPATLWQCKKCLKSYNMMPRTIQYSWHLTLVFSLYRKITEILYFVHFIAGIQCTCSVLFTIFMFCDLLLSRFLLDFFQILRECASSRNLDLFALKQKSSAWLNGHKMLHFISRWVDLFSSKKKFVVKENKLPFISLKWCLFILAFLCSFWPYSLPQLPLFQFKTMLYCSIKS